MEAEKKDKQGVVEVEENVETQGAASGAAKEEEVAGRDMMITLKSSDEKLFQVSAAAAARQSKLLAGMIKGGSTATGCAIPLEKIGSEALGKVVDYCNKHSDSDPSAAAGGRIIIFDTEASKDLEKWDRKLVDRLSRDALFDLIEAADFLNMEGLLDVTCRKVADMMKGKTAAQIREIFNIKNDFVTKDEEKQVREEHAWAFFDSDSKSR